MHSQRLAWPYLGQQVPWHGLLFYPAKRPRLTHTLSIECVSALTVIALHQTLVIDCLVNALQVCIAQLLHLAAA